MGLFAVLSRVTGFTKWISPCVLILIYVFRSKTESLDLLASVSCHTCPEANGARRGISVHLCRLHTLRISF